MKATGNLISAIIWLIAGICFGISLLLALTKPDAVFSLTTILSIVVCILCFVNAFLQFRLFLKAKKSSKDE
jgi:membrane protein DedA with SNARE-associated domain